MAIVITHKASIFAGANAAAYATGSWTPTAGRLAICSVVSGFATAPNIPTVSGNGITWTELTNYLCDTSGANNRITVFVALTTGASAGAVTADFAAQVQTGAIIIVDEVEGANVSGTALNAILQFKTGSLNASGLSESITLTSAITGGNASYGAFEHQVTESSSAGAGYTILGNGSHAGPANALITVYKSAGAQVVDASWATSGAKGGIALEIKASTAGLSAILGQATETDLVQLFTRLKNKAVGQVLEVDGLQSLLRNKQASTFQNTEVDLLQPVNEIKRKELGLLIELSGLLSGTQQKQFHLAQLLETEELFAITSVTVQGQILFQLLGTEELFSVGLQKVKTLSLLSELDTILPFVKENGFIPIIYSSEKREVQVSTIYSADGSEERMGRSSEFRVIQFTEKRRV